MKLIWTGWKIKSETWTIRAKDESWFNWKIHIKRRPKVHINYKSTDKQLKKPQTHKLKPKKNWKTSQIFNKASKVKVFLPGRKKSTRTPIITCLRDWKSGF